MTCGVGRRLNLDLVLLCLWSRPAAAALIQPLAWKPPYTKSVLPLAHTPKKRLSSLFKSSPMAPVEFITLKPMAQVLFGTIRQASPLAPGQRFWTKPWLFSIYGSDISSSWFIHASRPFDSSESQSSSPSKRSIPPRLEYIQARWADYRASVKHLVEMWTGQGWAQMPVVCPGENPPSLLPPTAAPFHYHLPHLPINWH